METINLKDFIENPDNPSKASDEDIERLAGKLKRVPIGLTAIRIAYVTDHTHGKNVVLSGNKRLRVLKRAYGDDASVPAEWFADITAMTPDQRHEFIVDANISDGEWDLDKLLAQYTREELAELMTETDLAELISDIEEPEAKGETDPDTIPEIHEEPKSMRGSVYQLGRHRLMCGDSTNAVDVARLMEDTVAELMITDPPYGISVVGKNGEVGANFGVAKKGKYKEIIADDSIDTAKNAYNNTSRFAKRHIIFGGNYFLSFLPVSDSWIIWDKRCDSGIRNTFADGEMAWCSFDTPVRIYHQLWNGMIRSGEHSERVHPTQKPINLFSEIIKDFSKDGDVILDIFGGSGTTVIACEITNRVCLMIEMSDDYCDVIRRRWAEFVHGEGCDWKSLTPAIAS